MNMFNRLSGTLVLVLLNSFIFGQQKTGIEWINPSKVYYKLKVADNGIYRITYEDLVSAGWSHGPVSAGDLRLINFGTEHAIHTSNSAFGPGAWFEFYGEKNTIGLDSLLYSDWKKDLLNTEYSLVSDTNAYFLTLSPETVNLRYTQINPDYSSTTLTPLAYYLHTDKVVYSSTFFKNVDGDVRNSYFEPSEGFASGTLQVSSTTLQTSSFVESGPQPVLSFRLGQNNQQARVEITWNGQLKETVVTSAKSTNQFTYTLNKQEISASNTLGLKNVNSANDRHIIAYASLTYPRSFTFDNKPSYLFSMGSSSSKRLLQISDFNTEGTEVYLYDFKNRLRYATGRSGNKVLAIVNPVASETGYALTNTITGYKTIPSISVFKPRSFNDKGSNYIIISNKNLYNFGPDYVQEYADYRSSPEGGSYKTELIEIQDIYDHFGYGIDRHFQSVKNMASYLKTNWKSARFVMMIGKALEYPEMRTQNDVLNNINKTYFLPTYGYLGSDNMLFSETSYPDPYFAIGRIAARSPNDIKNYLDKVKLYDSALQSDQTIESKYWTKKVLHLGGGKTDFEQNAIKNGLDAMATLLRDTVYGADVFSYFKNTFDAIQVETNEEINSHFNEGLAIVNFFGHSSPNVWDFTIDNPKNYSNFGKFPVINSFGCYSGNLHGNQKALSETFVLEKDRGSISFFASTGTAFISSLASYGVRFYNLILNDYRYKTIGEAITALANQGHNTQYAERSLISQLTYHGDPAIKLLVERKSDFLFNEKKVSTIPNSVQASMPTFEVEVEVINLGAYFKDSVEISFTHLLPNGTPVDTIFMKIPGIANKQNVKVNLNNHGAASIGKNKLLALIDPNSKISEFPLPSAEANNELIIGGVQGFDFYVTDNFARAIYPPDYGMINTPQHFILKASTSGAPINKTKFIFQIDTTRNFDSPLLEKGMVESEGGLLVYSPLIQQVSDRVYYWRVSPDSINEEGYKWSGSSFAFIPNEQEGWNQSHFFQFTDNSFKDLEISEITDRKFDFGKQYESVKLRNKIWDPFDMPGYTYNNNLFVSVRPWLYMDSGIGMVVNNQFNMWDLLNPAGGLFGSYNPSGTAIDDFSFFTDTPENRKKAMDFIEDKVKKGYYLSFFTIQKTKSSNYHPEDWAADSLIYGKSLYTVLEKLGAKKIRQLKELGSVPYIVQLVNGKEGVLAEEIATSPEDIVESSSYYYSKLQNGSTNSVNIGPATSFKELKFKVSELNSPKEKSLISVYGINSSGLQNKIDSNLTQNKVLNVNSSVFKQISLQEMVYDSTERSAPQLDFWRVSYDPLPDAAITFVKSEPNPSNNEVNQGEKVKIFYNVTSVNFVAMDSILVKFSYTDNNNQAISAYKKLGKLDAGQTLSDVIEFPIPAGTTSEIRFIIEINPDNAQPELHHFNNVLTKLFNVSRDKDNPLLDVYFDGIHIMDGDIVSPKPEILITLEDENTLLPVTDPNLFEVKLDTGRNQLIEIPMNGPQISFTPAGNGNKTAKVLFTPTLKEGDYKLLVQARDASGNKSGINPRVISFRVIERQSVSNVLNYPNPFSTSTQFIFTLTGAQVPDVMSLSIMTLTGKVVREITKEQLGPLHIGVNRTEYKWDGTDEYGSKLANGVYLYKVNVRKSDGSLYDSFTNDDIDSFFTKGFGKLVILR